MKKFISIGILISIFLTSAFFGKPKTKKAPEQTALKHNKPPQAIPTFDKKEVDTVMILPALPNEFRDTVFLKMDPVFIQACIDFCNMDKDESLSTHFDIWMGYLKPHIQTDTNCKNLYTFLKDNRENRSFNDMMSKLAAIQPSVSVFNVAKKFAQQFALICSCALIKPSSQTRSNSQTLTVSVGWGLQFKMFSVMKNRHANVHKKNIQTTSPNGSKKA
ncbi:hypothetical protein HOM50_00630 [bacterium]|jgi:hypothetical protein|nr:hypothetical protein [bacterium]MBT5014896.1 hypothetical protein [bacterium]